MTAVLALPGPLAAAEKVVVAPEHARARYLLSLPGRAPGFVPSHEANGHFQRSRPRADGTTELTVIVSPKTLASGTSWPVSAEDYPARVRPFMSHDAESQPSAAIIALAKQLTRGLFDEAAVSERVLEWVSREVVQVQKAPHEDTAASTLAQGLGSCVGRSRLAVSLLREAGLPARTVHGLVVPTGSTRGTALGSADFALHRFVKSYLLADGWVLSDPGESIHVVDTRHLVLALDGQPFDPEAFRGLRLTPLEDLGFLKASRPAPSGRTLVFRSVGGRQAPSGRRLPQDSEVLR